MKKHFAIALAATMVVGGMSVRSFADDSPAVDAQQKAAQAAQQAGNQGGTAAQNAGSGAAAAAQNLADRAETRLRRGTAGDSLLSRSGGYDRQRGRRSESIVQAG